MLFIERGSIPHSFANSFNSFQKTIQNKFQFEIKKEREITKYHPNQLKKSGELIVFIVNKKTHTSFMTLPKHFRQNGLGVLHIQCDQQEEEFVVFLNGHTCLWHPFVFCTRKTLSCSLCLISDCVVPECYVKRTLERCRVKWSMRLSDLRLLWREGGCDKAVSEVVVVFALFLITEGCIIVVIEESRNLSICGRFSWSA